MFLSRVLPYILRVSGYILYPLLGEQLRTDQCRTCVGDCEAHLPRFQVDGTRRENVIIIRHLKNIPVMKLSRIIFFLIMSLFLKN